MAADETILVDVDYNTSEAQKNVNNLADDIFELTQANKELREQQKLNNGTTEKEIATRKELNRRIESNKDAIKRARKERNNSVRAITGEKSALQKLGKTLKAAATSYLGVAAAIGIFVKGIGSIIKGNVEFENSLASLSAITGATGEDLDFFARKSKELSSQTLQSATDIVKAFELVGSARPELLKDSEALAEVTKQAIILSEATGGKLGLTESANAVAGAMNQFKLQASEAARVINAFAAGSKLGSATTDLVSESFKNFGTVANDANFTVEQAIGAVELLAENQLKGAEAGTKLRGVTLKLQQAGVGYISGQFDINDAIDEANKLLDEQGTQLDKDQLAIKLFGAENITAGKIILNNKDRFNELTQSVTGTTIALEQQAIQNDTLGNNWKKLMNGIKNLFISTNISGFMNKIVKDISKSFDEFIIKIEGVKLVWQRLKGELTKQEYRQALEDLNNGITNIAETTEESTKITEEDTKATEESTKAIKAKTLSVKELAALEKKKAEERKALIEEEKFDRELALEEEKAFNAEIAEINKAIDEEERLANEAFDQFQLESEEKKIEMAIAGAEKRKEIFRQSVREIGSIANDFANFLVNSNKNRLDLELAAEEAKKNKALELAGDDARKREKIERDFEIKKQALQRDTAKKNQKIQIGNAIIQGAIVVLNALGTKPFVPLGLIAALGAGIATALQIATIKQQKFTKGGKVQIAKKGMQMGTFAGANHAGGGIDLYTGSGKHVANVEGKENFYVINKNASDYINSLSDINQRIGNGVPLAKRGFKMQEGGQADINTDVNINDLTERVIKNLPPIITQVVDVKTGLEQRKEVINVGIV